MSSSKVSINWFNTAPQLGTFSVVFIFISLPLCVSTGHNIELAHIPVHVLNHYPTHILKVPRFQRKGAFVLKWVVAGLHKCRNGPACTQVPPAWRARRCPAPEERHRNQAVAVHSPHHGDQGSGSSYFGESCPRSGITDAWQSFVGSLMKVSTEGSGFFGMGVANSCFYSKGLARQRFFLFSPQPATPRTEQLADRLSCRHSSQKI